MRTRNFASVAREVGVVGLGCMGMSWAYAESGRDDERSIAVIRAALDRGINVLDTADVYGDGHNENLVGKALVGRRNEAFLATKAGLVVDDLVTKAMHRDGSPEHIRRAVDASLQRLGTDVIDLYYLHRIDPRLSLEETWGAMSELVRAGKVRHLGLSEVSVAQAERAHAVHPVAAVQSEFSLWWRAAAGESGPDQDGGGVQSPSGDVLGWCARNGAIFVPFAPLGRGFLTGDVTADTSFEPTDFRAVNPRFQPEARAANLRIVDVVSAVAKRHDATPAQIAIAWVLAQGDHVLPIPGTRQEQHLAANAAAADVVLTDNDLVALKMTPAPVGSRY